MWIFEMDFVEKECLEYSLNCKTMNTVFVIFIFEW